MTDEPRTGPGERHFAAVLGLTVALGALVRFVYVLRDQRALIGGDGVDYHLSALRLADGLGYTVSLGDVGAQTAHHPPGWVTVLGAVSWLGARSWRAHQLVGVVIGLGVVALIGVVGRRYFGARVGLVAAALAALYPGFWLLEGNILSEPLGLLVLACFTLAVASLHDRPTLGYSLLVGALCGLVGLVRSEQALLLPIVVAPVLLRARTLVPSRRVLFLSGSVVAFLVVIAPWTIFNFTRFKEPVYLSTNDGGLLLAGNCPPTTYSGKYLGYYGGGCYLQALAGHPGIDRSQANQLWRNLALKNMAHNAGKLPVVVPARVGRAVAAFRPAQTVHFVADWMGTSRPLVWSWVVFYWLLVPLAVFGGIQAWRSGAFMLPFLGPLLIAFVSVAISYGEPRYHTPSDLGVLLFAAVAIDRIAGRRSSASAVVHRSGLAEDETDGAGVPSNVA